MHIELYGAMPIRLFGAVHIGLSGVMHIGLSGVMHIGLFGVMHIWLFGAMHIGLCGVMHIGSILIDNSFISIQSEPFSNLVLNFGSETFSFLSHINITVSSVINMLTHLTLVPHICVSEWGQHWFRWWLVAYSAPSHYLNQCWIIVRWTLRNTLQWNFNQNTKLFIHLFKCIWKRL